MAPAGLGAMGVFLLLEFDGDRDEPPVTDPALGEEVPRKVAHIAHRALQQGNLETAVMVQMHVHRCNRQIVAVMKRPGQPLR
jgi:hypothetical protein